MKKNPVLWLFLVVFSMFTPTSAALIAHSQDAAEAAEAATPVAPPGEEVDAALALAVAQVSFNEAPGYPADELLIWQTTRGHGDTSAERLAWLTEHSDCVLSDREMTSYEVRSGNCRWTRHLDDEREIGIPPLGWPAHWRWSGRWEEIWSNTLDHATRLVAGERPHRGWPCTDETPLTWGGDLDLHGALERGLRPITCLDHATGRPTENTGYVRAARTARVAPQR